MFWRCQRSFSRQFRLIFMFLWNNNQAETFTFPGIMDTICALIFCTPPGWDNMAEINRIQSIIGVQWRQGNPSPRVHRSSRKRGLPNFSMERWIRGLEFFCRHWTSMIDSFSQMPLPNIFKIGFYFIWTWSIRSKWVKQKISSKSNNFGRKLFLLFKLRKRIPTLDIFIKK